MAAGRGLVGREIAMTIGGATLLGIVDKSISYSNAGVEVTDDQSSGFRELLATGGLKAVDLSISGITKNYELLRTISNASSQMMACSISLGDATTESTLVFDALLTSVEHSGASNERVEFSAELQSSGAVVFTAGS
jgi:predicted secreted protein